MNWWQSPHTRRTALVSLAGLFVTGCSTPPKARIPAGRFQGRTTVACIGDSITAGSGLPSPESSAYPAVLAQLLGSSYDVRNFGVSGATLVKDGDHPYFATPQFNDARYLLPQVVVIALGTNDSKPQNWRYQNTFDRDLYAIVRAFLMLPSQPTVYVCTPPTVFQDRWGITANITSGQIAPRIRRACAREGWPMIDLQRATRSSSDYFPDGVHPDAVGAAQIATTVEAAFRGR